MIKSSNTSFAFFAMFCSDRHILKAHIAVSLFDINLFKILSCRLVLLFLNSVLLLKTIDLILLLLQNRFIEWVQNIQFVHINCNYFIFSFNRNYFWSRNLHDSLAAWLLTVLFCSKIQIKTVIIHVARNIFIFLSFKTSVRMSWL